MAVSEISEWYYNKTVFITGATGFMGKVLVVKLLKSCKVRKIYVLMRPKRDVDIRQRLEEMLSFKIFDNLKQTQPEALQKVVPVKGDITMENLGLNEDDEDVLAAEVNVIFHAAATINFQEPLRTAVNMNMLGTKRVVSLANKMRNLNAFVHVSTAYGNCHLPEIYEELYPVAIDPGRLIQMTEWLDDDVLEVLSTKLIEPRPNTYTFTKALAEQLLVNDGRHLPIVIIRPSIVCGAWKEPLPGWVDNMFAFTGLLVGMGKGVLRSLYVKKGIRLDFVPVDLAINLMICSAWNTAMKRCQTSSSVPIYCCSSGPENPLTVDRLEYLLKNYARKIPLDSPLWYPDGSSKTNRVLHNVHVYVSNVIPAYLFDFVMKILGKKAIAVKLCNKMFKAINALEYFMLRDWTFHNHNTRALWNSLSPADQKIFHFSISEMDWEEYIYIYTLGTKQYFMKESLDNLPTARRTLNMLYWINRLFQLVLLYGAWLVVSSEFAQNTYSLLLTGAVHILKLAPLMAAAEEAEEL